MAFTVVPACRLAGLPIAALSIEGFRGLVTSSTTPIATGRSDGCQAGLDPAENPHLFTTHVKELPCRRNQRRQDAGQSSGQASGILADMWTNVKINFVHVPPASTPTQSATNV